MVSAGTFRASVAPGSRAAKIGTNSWARARNSASGGVTTTASYVPHLLAQKRDRRLNATRSVRNVHRAQRHFDHTERPKYHRRVDVPHMGDAKRLARQVA